jgi:hypothetical protein
MILFPDTHFFLHFRDAPELPWSEITPEDEVRLVVCRTIQREIDRKEHELRGRPQRRARKFAAQIGDIGVSGVPLVLRENGPRVTLDYRRRPAGWQPPAGLSEGWGDDMMVADALAFMEATGEVVAVLTNDIGVYQTARDHGVTAFYLRGKDHWQLPEESDDRDKELARLKAENSELRRSGPAVTLLTQVEGVSVKEISIEVIRFAPLSVDQIQRLMGKLRDRHPLVTDFSKPNTGMSDYSAYVAPMLIGWMDTYEDEAPTEEEIRLYTEDSYPTWLQRAQTYLETLPERLEDQAPETLVTFRLSNQGTVPAEGVILEFEALGALLLAEQPEENESEEGEVPATNDAAFPMPPAAPSWKRVRRKNPNSAFEAMRGMAEMRDQMGRISVPSLSSHFERIPERKPYKFYWAERPEGPCQSWSFTCEDFRHQATPEDFPAKAVVLREQLTSGRVGVRVRVSARNMRAAFQEVVPVRVVERVGDTENEALKLIPSKFSALRFKK